MAQPRMRRDRPARCRRRRDRSGPEARGTRRQAARIAYRAPQMNTNGCCLLRYEDPLAGRQQPIGITHVAGASLSGPRVGPAVDVPDPFTGEMGVELRGGDTRMPEQLLDDAQVGPALEQVRRERVAQRVRADPIGEAGPRGGALDRGPRLLAGQPAAAIAEEERAAAERARRGGARGARRADRRIQRPSQSRATSPTGTSRSLSPLPMTRTKAPSTERSSRSRPIASLIRRPAAYRSSSRARSRRAWPGAVPRRLSRRRRSRRRRPPRAVARSPRPSASRAAAGTVAAGRGAPRRRRRSAPRRRRTGRSP